MEANGTPAGPTTAPAAVYRSSGTSYTDLTAAAANDAADDVTTGGAMGDFLYIGHANAFDQIDVRVGKPGEGGLLVWEYRASEAWRELQPSDATDGFHRDGPHVVSWNPPDAWQPTVLHASNAPGSFYYVRARVTEAYRVPAILSMVSLEVWKDPLGAQTEAAAAFLPTPGGFERPMRAVALTGIAVIAVGEKGTLARSGNGGTRWSHIASPVVENLQGIAFQGPNGVAVGDGGTVLRSTDEGWTWVRAASGTQATLRSVAWTTPGNLVAVGDEIILRSNDGGATWTSATQAGKMFKDVSFDGAYGWAVGDDGTDVVALSTTDGGGQWTPKPINVPSVLYAKGVAVLGPSNNPTVWVVGDQFKLKLKTNGDWFVWPETGFLKDVTLVSAERGWFVGDRVVQHLYPGAPGVGDQFVTRVDGATLNFKGVAAHKDGHVYVAGDSTLSSGVVLHSLQGTTFWRAGARPTDDLRSTSTLGSGVVWAVGNAGLVMRSPDAGANWSALLPPWQERANAIHFSTNRTGWIVGAQGLMRATNDGGETWNEGDLGEVTALDLNGVDVTAAGTGWIVGALGTIFHTTDGIAWTRQSTSPTQEDLRAVDHVVESVVYAVGASGTLLRTQDGGANWAKTSLGTADLFAVRFADAAHGWAAGAQGVWTTINEGTTWGAQTLPSVGSTGPGAIYALGVASADVAWAGGSAGAIFRTNNGGLNWTTVSRHDNMVYYGIAGTPNQATVAVGSAGRIHVSQRLWENVTSAAASGGASFAADASHAPGDAVYVGQGEPFDAILTRVVKPAAVGAVVAWEYATAAGWKGLQAIDGSNAFGHTGLGLVKFPLPADWTATRVGEDGASRYWVRARFATPPSAAQVFLSEINTLRMLTPLDPPTTNTAPPTATVPGFSMAADPREIHFGPLARGAAENRTVKVHGIQGTASAAVSVDGPAASWFRLSATTFQLAPKTVQTLRLDLVVPRDAPPGPADARLVVEARPTGSTATVRGWVPLDLTVAAADLVDVTYDAAQERWSARFANHLTNAVGVKVEATARPPGGPVATVPGSQMDVAPGTERTFEGSLESLPSGAYDLDLAVTFEGERRARQLRVFVGGPAVAIDGLTIDVAGPREVTFRFTVTNLAGVLLDARPAIHVEDQEGNEVDVVAGEPVSLEAGGRAEVVLKWEPQFGAYNARARADVEHAVPAAAQAPFQVQGTAPPDAGTGWIVWAAAGAVVVINVVVGIGLWSGTRRKPPV